MAFYLNKEQKILFWFVYYKKLSFSFFASLSQKLLKLKYEIMLMALFKACEYKAWSCLDSLEKIDFIVVNKSSHQETSLREGLTVENVAFPEEL